MTVLGLQYLTLREQNKIKKFRRINPNVSAADTAVLFSIKLEKKLKEIDIQSISYEENCCDYCFCTCNLKLSVFYL